MQRAIETLNHFPSFAEILLIDAELGNKSKLELVEQRCEWCNGEGIVMMDDGKGQYPFCCDCPNGQAQYAYAKGKTYPSGQPFRLHYASYGLKFGWFPVNLTEERAAELRRSLLKKSFQVVSPQYIDDQPPLGDL
jgi:hypothetical protein